MTGDSRRTSGLLAGHIACLVADGALLAWTLALWWRPSTAKVLALHKALPWAADSCAGATFLGVAVPFVIAGAILALALASSGRHRATGFSRSPHCC